MKFVSHFRWSNILKQRILYYFFSCLFKRNAYILNFHLKYLTNLVFSFFCPSMSRITFAAVFHQRVCPIHFKILYYSTGANGKCSLIWTSKINFPCRIACRLSDVFNAFFFFCYYESSNQQAQFWGAHDPLVHWRNDRFHKCGHLDSNSTVSGWFLTKGANLRRYHWGCHFFSRSPPYLLKNYKGERDTIGSTTRYKKDHGSIHSFNP